MYSRRMAARALRWKIYATKMFLKRAWCFVTGHDYRFLFADEDVCIDTCLRCGDMRKFFECLEFGELEILREKLKREMKLDED